MKFNFLEEHNYFLTKSNHNKNSVISTSYTEGIVAQDPETLLELFEKVQNGAINVSKLETLKKPRKTRTTKKPKMSGQKTKKPKSDSTKTKAKKQLKINESEDKININESQSILNDLYSTSSTLNLGLNSSKNPIYTSSNFALNDKAAILCANNKTKSDKPVNDNEADFNAQDTYGNEADFNTLPQDNSLILPHSPAVSSIRKVNGDVIPQTRPSTLSHNNNLLKNIAATSGHQLISNQITPNISRYCNPSLTNNTNPSKKDSIGVQLTEASHTSISNSTIENNLAYAQNNISSATHHYKHRTHKQFHCSVSEKTNSIDSNFGPRTDSELHSYSATATQHYTDATSATYFSERAGSPIRTTNTHSTVNTRVSSQDKGGRRRRVGMRGADNVYNKIPGYYTLFSRPPRGITKAASYTNIDWGHFTDEKYYDIADVYDRPSSSSTRIMDKIPEYHRSFTNSLKYSVNSSEMVLPFGDHVTPFPEDSKICSDSYDCDSSHVKMNIGDSCGDNEDLNSVHDCDYSSVKMNNVYGVGKDSEFSGIDKDKDTTVEMNIVDGVKNDYDSNSIRDYDSNSIRDYRKTLEKMDVELLVRNNKDIDVIRDYKENAVKKEDSSWINLDHGYNLETKDLLTKRDIREKLALDLPTIGDIEASLIELDKKNSCGMNTNIVFRKNKEFLIKTDFSDNIGISKDFNITRNTNVSLLKLNTQDCVGMDKDIINIKDSSNKCLKKDICNSDRMNNSSSHFHQGTDSFSEINIHNPKEKVIQLDLENNVRSGIESALDYIAHDASNYKMKTNYKYLNNQKSNMNDLCLCDGNDVNGVADNKVNKSLDTVSSTISSNCIVFRDSGGNNDNKSLQADSSLYCRQDNYRNTTDASVYSLEKEVVRINNNDMKVIDNNDVKTGLSCASGEQGRGVPLDCKGLEMLCDVALKDHADIKNVEGDKIKKMDFYKEELEYENRRLTDNLDKSQIERKVVYVGKIEESLTTFQLRKLFDQFGVITDCTVHFREYGENYGFVTFLDTVSACNAVQGSQKMDRLKKYDVCFGGRRKFCQHEYFDLDGRQQLLDDLVPASSQRYKQQSFASLLHDAIRIKSK